MITRIKPVLFIDFSYPFMLVAASWDFYGYHITLVCWLAQEIIPPRPLTVERRCLWLLSDKWHCVSNIKGERMWMCVIQDWHTFIYFQLNSNLKRKPVESLFCLFVYLVNYIFPVLDELEAALVAVCVFSQVEGSCSSPQFQFSQRLSDCHFALSPIVQVLKANTRTKMEHEIVWLQSAFHTISNTPFHWMIKPGTRFRKRVFKTELEPKLSVEGTAMFGHQTSNQGGCSSPNSLQASTAAETRGSLEKTCLQAVSVHRECFFYVVMYSYRYTHIHTIAIFA